MGTQEEERSLLTIELGWTVKTTYTEIILLFRLDERNSKETGIEFTFTAFSAVSM